MKLNKFLRKLFHKADKPDYHQVQYVESLADVPKYTGTTIYIVSNDNKHKWVAFQCPNKCGKRIEVNLMTSKYPHWTITVKRKKVTLYPSVVVEGCGAHFWVTDSKVIPAKFYYEE